LVAYPLESPRRDQAHNQEVVTAETGSILPVFSFLVGPLERDVEHGAFVGFLAPNAGADRAMTEFMHGLSVWFTSCRLVFHDVFVLFIY
jgi:hypothetical protein